MAKEGIALFCYIITSSWYRRPNSLSRIYPKQFGLPFRYPVMVSNSSHDLNTGTICPEFRLWLNKGPFYNQDTCLGSEY